MPVSRGDVVQSVAAPGQIECTQEVQLGMATDGQLATLRVRPGESGREGDTLAGLNLAPLQQALTRAQAALERARQLAATQLDLAVAQTSLAKAQATAPHRCHT